MSLTAKLQFGDNETGLYDKEYKVTDFKCHFLRRNNEARPDSSAQCDRVEFTVVAPGQNDLTLYEWYVNRSAMSGRILIELSSPARNEDSEWKEILFEDGVCFSMSEEYHIDRNVRRTLKLQIAASEITVDDIVFKTLK